MTEKEKYEIATLAGEVSRLRQVYEAHAMMNTPTDPLKAEEAFAALKIAETEWLEAISKLRQAQGRILSKR